MEARERAVAGEEEGEGEGTEGAREGHEAACATAAQTVRQCRSVSENEVPRMKKTRRAVRLS